MKYLLWLLVTGLVVACGGNEQAVPERFQEVGEAQGTTYSIIYYDSIKHEIKPGIDSLLYKIDQSLSTYTETSVINQFNQADSCMIIDDFFLDVFLESYKVYTNTRGALNPTILPVLNAWGFGPKDALKFMDFPSDSLEYLYRDSLAQSLENWVDFDEIELAGDVFTDANDENSVDIGENYICKSEKGIQLDFNAIAQGYSVDRMAKYLLSKGISNFLIELGGELRASGSKPHNIPWKVAVENPMYINGASKEAIAAEVELINQGMATSGNYRKNKTIGGIELGHTIDPRTNRPVNTDIISITVFASSTIMADAYSTAFMVMGMAETAEFVVTNREDDLEVFIIYEDEQGEVKTYKSVGIMNQLNVKI